MLNRDRKSGVVWRAPADDHDIGGAARDPGHLRRRLRAHTGKRRENHAQINQCAGNHREHGLRVTVVHGLSPSSLKAINAASSPRPVAMTTTCRPIASRYVIGVAVACLGKT